MLWAPVPRHPGARRMRWVDAPDGRRHPLSPQGREKRAGSALVAPPQDPAPEGPTLTRLCPCPCLYPCFSGGDPQRDQPGLEQLSDPLGPARPHPGLTFTAAPALPPCHCAPPSPGRCGQGASSARPARGMPGVVVLGPHGGWWGRRPGPPSGTESTGRVMGKGLIRVPHVQTVQLVNAHHRTGPRKHTTK